MWTNSFWQRWLRRSTASARLLRKRQPSRRTRLCLEPLEDRMVPTTFTVNNGDVATLINDINSANQATQADTIVLAANGVYNLTAVNNSVNGANGLPVISTAHGLTIEGNGATIERSSAAGTPQFRLLEMAASAVLTLQDLTLTNGLAEGSAGANAGGSILNHHGPGGGGSGQGGALYMAGGALDVINTTFSADVAQGGNGGNSSLLGGGGGGGNAQGGALYVAGGALSVTNSTFSADVAHGGAGGGGDPGGNGGSGEGGALYMAGGTLSVTNNTFSGDVAEGGPGEGGLLGFGAGADGNAQGGALYMAGGTLSVTSTTFSVDVVENAGSAEGGAVYVAGGTLSVADTIFTADVAENAGSAEGGAVYVADGTLSVADTTFSADVAQGRAGQNGGFEQGAGGGDNGQGGAVDMAGGTLTVINATFSGNVAQGGPGGTGGFDASGGSGGNGQGGALAVTAGTLTLEDTTISGNSAAGGAGGNGGTFGSNGSPGSGQGGALYLAGATLALSNTIAAGNTGSDVYNSGGTIETSASFNNLLGTLVGAGLANGQNGNQLGVQINALALAPLGNYGGPTQTMALLQGSIAIGAGDVFAIPAGADTDQRGSPRLTNGHVDVGAFQSQGFPAHINTVFGNGQATVANPFGTSLEAQVTDGDGNPVAGVNVTFTESNGASGAGGSFGIAWGPLTPITTDVATLTQPGTVVEAAQWGNTGSIMVDGINFTQGSLNGGGPVADTTAEGVGTGAFSGTTGNASFDSVLNGFAWDESSSPYHAVTIFNLTPDQQYSVQLFSLDDRTTGNESQRINSFSDTSGDQSAPFSEGTNSYVIGTFIAQSASETIHVNLAPGNLGNINALVVRSLSGSGITVQTNAAGIATAPALTANDIAGSFNVQVADAADGLSDSVQLTNIAGAAASITAVGGSGQNTIAGAAFSTLLQVKVTDQFGNRIANAPVLFSVPASGASGSFDASPLVYTNAQGIATAPGLIANYVRGSFTATATTSGVGTSATFSLSNTAVPGAISIVAGNKQQASVTAGFKTALQVKVTDAHGNPISGITVTFAVEQNGAAGATFTSQSSVLTGPTGIAQAPALTANGSAGTFTVEAWVDGLANPAVFTLTNVAGPAANISPVTTNLSATVGKAYSALQALVTDAEGNPVSGVKVTFTAPSGTHVVSGTFNGKATFTATTGPNGIASAPLMADTIAGAFTVTATINGVTTPASFSLTNDPGAPAKMTIVSGNKQTVSANTPFAALEVQVTDSFGNLLNNVPVTFTVQANKTTGVGATFSSTGKATTVNGLARAPQLTANAKPGSFTVIASVAGTPTTTTFALEIS